MNLIRQTTSKYGIGWDLYFLKIAKVVGSNSKCLSRKIGSVLVKDKSIVSTGYNGPPRKLPPCSSRVTQVLYDRVVPPGCTGKSTIKIDDIEYKDIWHSNPLIHNTCPRQLIGAKSGERLDLCIAGHSERNALIQAGREGIKTKGSDLYCYCGLPCKDCMIEIVNFGVDTVVCLEGPSYDNLAEYIAHHAGINIVTYSKDEV